MTLIDLPPAPPPHPAKFSASIMSDIADVLRREWNDTAPDRRVLDPMAGVGGIHALDIIGCETVGVELEAEWAAAHPRTIQGDVLDLPDEWAESFDAVITSPPYANRMADHHNARDNSRRMTYKHQLGRDLTEGSGAGMQWGMDYRRWASDVVTSMVYVTKPAGLIILNISNHIRDHKEMLVSEFWLEELMHHGLRLEKAIDVPTPRMGFGQNREARVDHEWVYVTSVPA